MDTVPVLFDTDIGSDIDDAIALAYLLKHPRCRLMGVTTVSGDVQKRAAIVEAICASVHRHDVPIHCGRRDVLFNGSGQPNVPQYEAIQNEKFRLNRPENTAVEFLRQTIRKHPGEITLLSVGPYSNIAILFALDPEIPSLLKSFVSMAGVFFQGERREWNCTCDPTATAVVYATPKDKHISIGLDVTEKCTLPANQVKARFVGEPLQTVTKFAETWFKNSVVATFHDPLAASIVFNPDICKYKSGKVTTTSASNCEQMGSTIFTEGDGSDQVAYEVNPDAFFEDYFKICAS